MASPPYNATGSYQPESTVGLPTLYAWPPRPLATLKYLFFDLLFPWGYLYIGLASVTWYYLTPSMETMAGFQPGWIALVWLRNAVLLTLVVGSLHWYLYTRHSQERKYKFNDRWHDGSKDSLQEQKERKRNRRRQHT